MTRWLITGATGLLGSNAALRLSQSHEVVGTARNRPPLYRGKFFEADLTGRSGRDGVVDKAAPDVVLHTAAIASIEACEREPELARALNVDAAVELAAQAEQAGATFVHISTDAVFDGEMGAYREDDDTSPTSEYGRTKRDAELAVLDANPQAIVARVNFYGWSPTGNRSLAEYFFNRLSEGQDAPGFTDTVVSTLYVDFLVDYLASLVRVNASGVFHVASGEPTSKFQLGRRIASAFGFDSNRVTASESTSVLEVRRGSLLSLDVSKLEAALAIEAVDQITGVEKLRMDHAEGRHQLLSAFALKRGN